jgi:hypothetical protein
MSALDHALCDGPRVPSEGEVAWVFPEETKPYGGGMIKTITYELFGNTLVRMEALSPVNLSRPEGTSQGSDASGCYPRYAKVGKLRYA